MRAPAQASVDELIRTAIDQKRLVQYRYKNKLRIVEPHDYGIHKGIVKLFGYQIGGLSSAPLPNWRWAEVEAISDLNVLDRRFAGGRGAESSKHHRWDKVFARVSPAEE